MNRHILLIVVIIFGGLIPFMVFSKRMPPRSSVKELARLKSEFVRAVKNENWSRVNELAHHDDAWAFVGVGITKEIGDSALRRAVRGNKFDVAHALIQAVGGFCSSQKDLIIELDTMIKDAQQVLIELQKANSICI
jgi:hypothetical protein